jgi:hypothetical protein
MAEEPPIKVFVSYAHEDDALRVKIAKQLGILDIVVWVDREISAGEEWSDEIARELDAADIILLLISDDFLSSDFVKNVEIPRALERHADENARVVPVLVRPVNWGHLPISKLQAIPSDEKWVTGTNDWNSLDEAVRSVAKSIESVVEDINRERQRQIEEQEKAEEDYRREVAEALSDGHISDIGGQTLKDARQRLGLSEEKAREIEAGELQPIEEKQQNLAKYELSVATAIEKAGFPIGPELKDELKKRQSKLGLKHADVVGLEEDVATRLEKERKAKEAAERKAAAEKKAKAAAEKKAKAAAKKKAKAAAKKKAKAAAEREATAGLYRGRLQSKAETKAWVRVLTTLLEEHVTALEFDLYVAPEIPESKLWNAQNLYDVPDDEKAIGLINATVFGSAKNGLMFGVHGLYFRNAWSANLPGTHSVPYSSLPSANLTTANGEVHLGDGVYFDSTGGPDVDAIIDLLEGLISLIDRQATGWARRQRP